MGDRVLVIGYGNTLRGDDGAGPAVAQQVAAWQKEGVAVRICQQLTPELAADLASVELAIFIDARATTATEIEWQQLQPQPTESGLGHVSDPRSLLAWAQALYQRAPVAYWLLIPAADFSFSEAFSPLTASATELALAAIARALAAWAREANPTANATCDRCG